MNQFYRNRDWFCHGCSMSIFPFLSLADDDFLIACNELNYPHRTNINIENVKNMDKEANTFTEAHKTDEKCCDFNKFDPDKNFSFEENCDYVYSLDGNRPDE